MKSLRARGHFSAQQIIRIVQAKGHKTVMSCCPRTFWACWVISGKNGTPIRTWMCPGQNVCFFLDIAASTSRPRQFRGSSKRPCWKPGSPNWSRCIATRECLRSGSVSRILPFAWLAPDISTDILEGRQPQHLKEKKLRILPELPLKWQEQLKILGFPHQ